jgi:hypothetical protein
VDALQSSKFEMKNFAEHDSSEPIALSLKPLILSLVLDGTIEFVKFQELPVDFFFSSPFSVQSGFMSKLSLPLNQPRSHFRSGDRYACRELLLVFFLLSMLSFSPMPPLFLH